MNCDVLVIGSGAAGLTCALQLADAGLSVWIFCKSALIEGSSRYAQGGIAAVQAADDSINDHVQDTLASGAGLCDEATVEFVVQHAKEAVAWLIDKGVRFTKDPKAPEKWPFHLVQEGGHSKRRIIHADDATGFSVQSTLTSLAKAHPNIQIFEHHTAIDLVVLAQKVQGAYLLNHLSQQVLTVSAKATVLATGGASRVYLYSTNPAVSSGDGIAMAFRAGCRIANMEFNQFHPTCLYHPEAGSFLITEAMRGEGAYLRLKSGERFLTKFHEQAELAPRDIVARAIDYEMKRLGQKCVYLDITHRSADFIKSHFPTIYEQCLHYGIDITTDQIPVVPAAHYTCGGVMVNHQAQSDLPGLYAVGEVAYTGLHGANRMASNSLLECLVFAMKASQDIIGRRTDLTTNPDLPRWDEASVSSSLEEILIYQGWDELRRVMWNYVGIVRSDKRLARAKARISLLTQEVNEYYHEFRVTRDLLELRNLVLVADLIVRSAQQRKESRGLHYTLDYPETSDRYLHPTILIKDIPPQNQMG